MVEIKLNGKVVSQSRNLRGILDYARKHYVREAACSRSANGGRLYLCFNNGAECRTEFADYSVLLRWIRLRRSWSLSEIYCSELATTFSILCGDARY